MIRLLASFIGTVLGIVVAYFLVYRVLDPWIETKQWRRWWIFR